MAFHLRAFLAKAFCAQHNEPPGYADSDYWWLIPQVTPWPPTPAAPAPDETGETTPHTAKRPRTERVGRGSAPPVSGG